MHGDGMAEPIGRRRALGLGLGVATTLASMPMAATATPDIAPADARLIYRKLRYRADSGLLFWWIKGPHFAEIGATLTPLYGLNLGTLQRVTQRDDGSFEVRDLEIAFRTDLDTGKRLTSFRNPITNQTVPVTLPPPRVGTISYSRDNVLHVPPACGRSRLTVDRYPTAPFFVGDEVFLRDRSRGQVTTPGAPTRVVNEISTFAAAREQVRDPHVMSAATRVQSNDVSDWPAWLGMGARPGIMALYGVGAKVPDLAAMPADWQQMLAEWAPDLARDPIAALDRAPGTTSRSPA